VEIVHPIVSTVTGRIIVETCVTSKVARNQPERCGTPITLLRDVRAGRFPSRRMFRIVDPIRVRGRIDSSDGKNERGDR
jgi:hypothetical protein